MIKMSRTMSQAGLAALLAAAWGLAGCCGGAPAHKCDFTPYTSQTDGGDAAVACGTQVCQPPQVCCLKKIAPFASCIDPQDYVADDCEMIDTDPPGCTVPQDCDGGVCCIQYAQETVACQPLALCPVDGTNTLLACSDDQDCSASPMGGTCHVLAAGGDGGLSLSACY
ncbi:MAG TPA: hypothetical protein VHG72_14385 [Polyangia bacterium]|nr:hypothetical protein [Polyangia bacterium]